MRFQKRGSVESYFLIVIITAIAGFLIALYFLSSTEYNTEAEICKLSVLSRATTPKGMQNYIPIKCYTTKYCLTKDMFGKCEEFAGETKVKRIQLPSNPEQAARKIEEINANAKYDCWEMMGQGKLDIVGDFWQTIGLGTQFEPICVLCSRIAIDKASFSDSCKKENYAKEEEKEKCIEELNKTFSLVDINNYMETHKVPGSALTYVQTFSNKAYAKLTATDKEKTKEIETNLEKIWTTEAKRGKVPKPDYIKDYKDESLERAYVFSQVKATDPKKALSNLGELSTYFAMGAATTPKIIGFVLKPYVLIPGLVVAGTTATYAWFNAKAGVEAAATYCGEFQSSIAGDRTPQGCSLIQSIPYNHKYVNSMCTAIEGNP